jgi:hypothetical protein
MTIQNPFGGPEDPYDKYRKYRVDGVDHEKHEERRKKSFEEEPAKKPLPTGSFLLVLMHKLLDYLITLGGHGISDKSEKEVRDDLHLLKGSFESLKWEERSQDVEFLNGLSEIWHRALEDRMRFKQSAAFSAAFRAFVKKIQNYPEGQEHTLGFYLTEYTGEKWLPFPYMELIQRIHEEYQSDPAASALSFWILELEQLIAALNPD